MLELKLQLKTGRDVVEIVATETLAEVVDCGEVPVTEGLEVTIVVDGLTDVVDEGVDVVEDGDVVVTVDFTLG